jgi:hypothetical protein
VSNETTTSGRATLRLTVRRSARATAWAVTIAAVLAAAGCGGSSKPKAITVTPIKPIGLSVSGLRTLARAVSTPIYWVGPKPHVLYELRRDSNGNVYVRYLPIGVKVGTPKASYLVVGTYPFSGAYAALQKVAGSAATTAPHGWLVAPSAKDPRSVHLALPNSNYQVEVYSPSAAQALALARSGRVTRVN